MHIFVNGWFCVQNSTVFRRFLTAFVQPCHSSATTALIRRSFVCNRQFTWVSDKPKSKFYTYVGVTLLWLPQFLPQRVFQCGPSRRLHGRRGLKFNIINDNNPIVKVAAFTGCVDWNTAVGDYKRNVPVTAFAGGMYAALRLCDLPPLCIFLNQKQGYCILDAATLFSEKTVIGEQRYSTDNVYRLSHIAMFVKSFPLKTAGSVLPNRCPENCRQSKYDRLGSRAQLLSRKKSEFDNVFCGSCLKFAYNKIMMLCAQYYKYWRNRSTAAQIKAAAVPANKYNA